MAQHAPLPATGGALPEEASSASTNNGDESEQDERDFVRALKKQSHLEHDLKKLHLTHRYDTKTLRAKVPWYRNSFEHTTPFTEICQDKAIEMGPPLVIPKDLRLLGAKRRYLRTVQLIADPLLVAAASARNPLLDDRADVPFEESLRKKDPARMKLQKANSYTMLSIAKDKKSRPANGNHKNKPQHGRSTSELPEYVSEGRDEDGGGCFEEENENEEEEEEEGKALPRQRTKSGKLQTRPPLLNPLQSSKTPTRMDHCNGPHRRLARQISLEEMEDLPNYKTYFGAHAKREFFAQYQNVYSRPYLFVESPALKAQSSSSTGNDNNSIEPPLASTASNCVPAYPTSKDLKRIAQELAPFGAGAAAGTAAEGGGANSELPTRDKLSPRSLFLTSCVTKPHLAVPFMLRKRMTKIFDFSFQSLGDTFIVEFAKCIVQDLPFVEEILVRDNRLSDDGLNALLEAVSEGSAMLNLLRLDISQNEMGERSAQTLRSYIASSYCTLTTLLVDNADIDDRECAAFMTAFEKNLSIKHLRMSRNCIGKMEHLNVVQPGFTTGGEAIASMLHRNLVLVHLDLSWNYLRLESSITLAKSIHENHTLKELILSYNACGDAGAMAFGEALRYNQCLEVLDLSYNSVGCKGAMVLANAIRVNQALHSLQLNGNNIGREGGQLMLFALCENQTENGCDVGLHACNLGASVLSSTSQGPPSAASYAQTTGSVAASPGGSSSLEFTLANLPVYSASSNRVFNPKEPTGKYILNLSEAYDKMIIMELVRLAKSKKGCRFLKIEHWANGGGGMSSSSKKTIQLIRKERDAEPNAPTQHNQSQTTATHQGNGSNGAEENSLETRGLDALFANIDKDKSGYIDQREVMGVLNRIGLFPLMDNLSTVLATYDYNSSGYLEQGEFSAFLFHAVFQMIDVDKSGKIDAEEMEEAFKMLGIAQYEQKEIAAAIATYDISGDGEIEESEFVQFMRDSLLEKIQLQVCSPLAGKAPSTGGNTTAGGGELSGNSLVTLLDISTHKAWVIPEDGRLEIEFIYEREAFASNEEAHRQCKISQLGIEQLIRNITQQASSKSEQDELFHVAIHDSEIKFTASQAYQMLEACGYMKPPDAKKVEMIAMILPQMLTAKEAQTLVSRTLTIKQRCRLKAELGSAYSVVLGNPTAHYSFDLAKPKDRIALNKIAEVAQSEKLFSKFKSGRADTSQHGNWENFRNEELDGQKIVLTNAFFLVLPRRGKLSFDYVSTTRPKRGTTPMSARRFEQLIDELKANLARGGSSCSDVTGKSGKDKPDGSDDDDAHTDATSKTAEITQAATPNEANSATAAELKPKKKMSVFTKQTQFWERTRASLFKHGGWEFVMTQATSQFLLSAEATREHVGMKLVQIESAVCDRWLACEQAAQIIACMPSEHAARPETARILFSRLIDIDSFYRIYDSLAPSDQYMCAKTLGWLNLCNPMKPERAYALDVSIHDEREMTKLLVELAIAEPGENWINQSFAPARGEPGLPGWKLPVRWEKDDGKDGGVNRAGFLEMEYYSGQDRGCAPVPAFRRTLMNRTLCGTKQYCL